MSLPEESGARRFLRRLLGWRLLCVFGIAAFLGMVARFHDPGTGFTSLISIGSMLGEGKVAGLRGVPHYVYEDSYGYDGAYYVQLALHPLVDNPELESSIDNLQYRAKRILLSWTAWLLGAGQPWWIVNVYPLLNVFSWLALAWLLWRWLPPDGLGNCLRWGGVMFSHGVLMSVRHSLVDLPSLMLVTAAVALWEKRRQGGAMTALAAAILTKETSILAGTLFAAPPATGWRWWMRNALIGVAVAAPLALWMIYVRVRVGPASDPGYGNFALPLAGLAEKWGTILGEVEWDGWLRVHVYTVTAILALTVQFFFFVFRRNSRDGWWRVGASFAVLTVFVSQPVWEGYPGAATRVLLPMTLAFNILVPRGAKWLPLLLVGNLSVIAGLAELKPPVEEFYQIRGDSRSVAALTIARESGWYQAETDGTRVWRWSRQSGVLRLTNHSEEPLQISMSGALFGITTRHFGLRLNGNEIWNTPLWPRERQHRMPPFIIFPGTSTLEFVTDQRALTQDNGDPRAMSFAVSNLVISVGPAKR